MILAHFIKRELETILYVFVLSLFSLRPLLTSNLCTVSLLVSSPFGAVLI